ncbi:MAG: peptide chain release factor N(5)-glutamine methyltransferase [Patescibacteria group bacterium]
MTLAEVTSTAVHTLRTAGVDSPELDAEILLAQVVGHDRTWILAHREYTLSHTEQKNFGGLLAQRAARVPIAYLTGHKEFFGLDFVVNKKVLTPRPETELLVQTALDYIATYPSTRSLLDIGTGSGAIACAIARHAPGLSHILAVDVSTAALEIAKQNAAHLGLSERVKFKRYHVGRMQTLKSRFDIIVSNPPYLSQKEFFEAKQSCPELTHEPQLALLGGTDGLLFITMVVRAAKKHLNRDGALFMEIGSEQAEDVKKLVATLLPGYGATIKKDLAGLDRIAEILPLTEGSSQ